MIIPVNGNIWNEPSHFAGKITVHYPSKFELDLTNELCQPMITNESSPNITTDTDKVIDSKPFVHRNEIPSKPPSSETIVSNTSDDMEKLREPYMFDVEAEKRLY